MWGKLQYEQKRVHSKVKERSYERKMRIRGLTAVLVGALAALKSSFP